MKTVVDLVSSLTTYLLGKDKAAKQAVEATIAPVEADASSSAAAYSVGDQLILNDILYDVTASISISNALVVGTNIAPANDLSTQIGGKQDQIEVTSMPTASASNVGQVLIYIGTTTSTYTSGQSYQSTFEGGSYIWKPAGLPTAAAVSYNGTQSGSSETDVQGAIDDLYSQKRTLQTNLTNLGNAAYQTSDSTESSIDNADYIPFYDTSASAKKRILKSNLVPSVNSTLSSSSTSPVQNKVVSKALGTVETIGGTATKAYSKGDLMLASTGQLYSVTADISQGGSISSGGNVGTTYDIVSQISNLSKYDTELYYGYGTSNDYGIILVTMNSETPTASFPIGVISATNGVITLLMYKNPNNTRQFYIKCLSWDMSVKANSTVAFYVSFASYKTNNLN